MINRILERFETEKQREKPFSVTNILWDRAIEIVQEVAKEYGKDTNVRSNEAEQYKLALFGIVRNSKMMPVGIKQGRSMEEINVMSLKTMEEIMGMSNFDALAQIYRDAEEALAKMGGK